MKKAVLFVSVFVLLVAGFACKGGGGKYGDAIDIMEKFIASNENLISALEKVTNADGVVAALNKATADLKELGPKMKSIGEKYPEFQKMETPPAEIKPVYDKIMALGPKIAGMYEKLSPYLTDPKVQEAQKAYQEASAAMQ